MSKGAVIKIFGSLSQPARAASLLLFDMQYTPFSKVRISISTWVWDLFGTQASFQTSLAAFSRFLFLRRCIYLEGDHLGMSYRDKSSSTAQGWVSTPFFVFSPEWGVFRSLTAPRNFFLGTLYGMDFHSISEGGYEYIEMEFTGIYHRWIYDSGLFLEKKGTLDFLVEPFLRLVFCGEKGGGLTALVPVYIFTYPYLRII